MAESDPTVPVRPAFADPGEGVVLLHGIARTAASMRKFERAMRQSGFETLNLDYPSRKMSLDDIASFIGPSVDDFARRLGGRLHFVTHSMGGLVARIHLARRRAQNLGRVVMLAPPNQGSEIADLVSQTSLYRLYFGPAGGELVTRRSEALRERLGTIDYPLGVIAGDRSIDPISWLLIPGPNDGKVAVSRTHDEGVADHITLHTSHPTMLLNDTAIAQALFFLRNGRFAR